MPLKNGQNALSCYYCHKVSVVASSGFLRVCFIVGNQHFNASSSIEPSDGV